MSEGTTDHASVPGATVRHLIDAINGKRLDDVRALLEARPELARMSADNLQVVHHAVLTQQPEVVRLLMANGANAREGVYPYREATTALALAVQRGDQEIAGIIEDEERRRPGGTTGMGPDPTPLHRAAFAYDLAAIARLLDEGADPDVRMHHDLAPLDVAAMRWHQADTRRFEETATLLLSRGARETATAAAALGDTAWLRSRHAGGALHDIDDGAGGLLRIAVTHDRPEVLRLLLDLGFDPDERTRVHDGDDAPATWGMALQAAVNGRRYGMAEMLLRRGADPNASIYASGDPVFSAYSNGDARMIGLLERHGGVPAATTAGLFHQKELASRMLSGETRYRIDGAAGPSLGEQLLWGATDSGDTDIVAMALHHVAWDRDDERWFTFLEQTLRHDSDPHEWDPRYLECFRMLLGRCDPNLRGRPTDQRQFGLTTLHNIVARGKMAAEERVEFATAILDAGARLDVRDNLLKSTPLGWACRWGQALLVRLFLTRGADPSEADTDRWARPLTWARRCAHADIEATLRRAGAG